MTVTDENMLDMAGRNLLLWRGQVTFKALQDAHGGTWQAPLEPDLREGDLITLGFLVYGVRDLEKGPLAQKFRLHRNGFYIGNPA